MVSRSFCIALLAAMGSSFNLAEAGHFHLRRGGCSDTCVAATYGGAGQPCGSPMYAPAVGYASAAADCYPNVGPAMSAPMSYGATSALAPAAATPQEAIDCGPVTLYKVVLEPQTAMETRLVPTTEYRDEVRYRTRTVQRTVPVEVQEFRTKTILVPKSETKSIEYSVLVPHTSEKSVELVETVPVWNEVTENYTVKVPKLNDVQEEYQVQVAKLADEAFTYTVYVPQAETQTRMQAVTNAVPVTKTRSIQVSVPVSRTQTVTKDYGHWDTLVEEVAVSGTALGCGTGVAPASLQVGGCGSYSGGYAVAAGCGQAARSCQPNACQPRARGCGCGHAGRGCSGACGAVANGCGVGPSMIAGYDAGAGCGQAAVSGQVTMAAPATRTVTRRVWVPNVVTEEVAVVENVMQSQEVSYTVYEQHTEQVPYECSVVSYRPEARTGTRQVVTYVPETRTRTRKVVSYSDETRTRTRKEVRYEQKTRTETIPVVSYTTEKRTKEVVYTVSVPETQVEPYTSTRYETVSEDVTEEYTERVPFASAKEVQVQVCRLVPKLVPYQVNPCAMNAQLSGQAGAGCGCAPVQTAGPVLGVAAGCANCQ